MRSIPAIVFTGITTSSLMVNNVSASNAVFQGYFFDVCGGTPTGTLAARCGETPGGTGDLSGNSETSLNPNQSLSNNEVSLARARAKTREVYERTGQLRNESTGELVPEPDNRIEMGPLSLLINGRATWFDRDRDDSDAERGYDGDSWGIELGFDYRATDQLILGAFVAYDQENSDFDEDEAGVNFTPAGNSGQSDADYYTVSLFGSYNLSDRAYLEGSVGYGWTSYTLKRNVVFQESTRTTPQTNVKTKGDPDGNEYWASIGAGYDFSRNALSFGPYVRASYARSEIDSYTEKDQSSSGLQMEIDDNNRNSITTDLGFRASYAVSTNWGVLIPQASFEYEHEFDQDAVDSKSAYALDASNTIYSIEGDDPDRDYFNLGAGLIGVLSNGMMTFVEYRGVVGYDDLTRHTVSAGLRIEF